MTHKPQYAFHCIFKECVMDHFYLITDPISMSDLFFFLPLSPSLPLPLLICKKISAAFAKKVVANFKGVPNQMNPQDYC